MNEQKLSDVEPLEPLPLPQDPVVLLLFGIFSLMVFYTLYFTGEIVIPIIMAFMLYLVLQPSMRLFARIHVPKPLAALLILAVFCGGLAGLGMTLAGPASEWVAKSHTALLGSRAMGPTLLQGRQVTPDHARVIAETGGAVGIWHFFSSLDKYVEGAQGNG